MKKLLVIGFIWPEPNSTAAGNRILQLIEIFQKQNYAITFVSSALKNENSFPLENINIKTFKIILNSSDFDEFLKKLQPDYVLFDRYLTEEQFSWKVLENCPNAIKILDTEDLHFLREARKIALKSGQQISSDLLINNITKREIASIYRCDLTIIISKYEMKLLTNKFKIDKKLLIYLPFLIEKLPENYKNLIPSFQERKNFIFMGNFKHEPNWNALQYLKSTIWPIIRKQLPKTEIHIYGAYTSKKVQQLNNIKDGFIVKGWTEDVKEVVQNSRIYLAPLLYGAGLKGKLIDAMQYGTPSITTSIGAEGMHGNLPWNGYITNSPEDFAKKAIKLYTHETLWENAQKNGFKILCKKFSKETYSEKFIKKLKKIEKNILTHRLNNFIGTMLNHHNLQSTKYFSKWIEEKNKK